MTYKHFEDGKKHKNKRDINEKQVVGASLLLSSHEVGSFCLLIHKATLSSIHSLILSQWSPMYCYWHLQLFLLLLISTHLYFCPSFFFIFHFQPHPTWHVFLFNDSFPCHANVCFLPSFRCKFHNLASDWDNLILIYLWLKKSTS